jgi:hypothetical protein
MKLTAVAVCVALMGLLSTSFYRQMVPDVTLEQNHLSRFGTSGCPAGDVNGDGHDDVVIGEPEYDASTTYSDSGRAYLYYGTDDGLDIASPRIFEPPKLEANGFFGLQACGVGDVNGDNYDDVAVSLSNYDGAMPDEGAVYVWYGSASGPSASYNWMAHGPEDDYYAHFGWGMGPAGDVNGDGYDDVIVGAYRYDYNSIANAYVWYGGPMPGGLGPTGTPANADWIASAPDPTASGNPAGSGFGVYVGTVGDVNGDGYDDIYVGAPRYSNPETHEGAIFVWYGSSAGLGDPGTLANADWHAESNQAEAIMGGPYPDSQWPSTQGRAGDVNGDGYDDLIVGAPKYDHPETEEGAAFLWYGSETGLGANGTPDNADWSVESNQASAWLGWSVGTAGDFSGNGIDDLVIGANYYDAPGQGNSGAIFMWLGSPSGIRGGNGTPDNAHHFAYGDTANAVLGFIAVTAGDVNGDGLGDVLATAPQYLPPSTRNGRAYVYLGFEGEPPRYLFLPLVMKN